MYMVFQMYSSSFISTFNEYWMEYPLISRLVRLIGYSSMTYASNFVGSICSPGFLALLTCVLLDFFLLIYINKQFQTYRHVPYYLCYLNKILTIALNFPLYPLNCAYCGRFMDSMFGNRQGEHNTIVSFLVFLIMIYIFTRTILLVSLTHCNIHLQNIFMLTWRPTSLARLLASIGIITFITHALPTDNPIPIVPLFVFVVSIVNFYFEWNYPSWVLEWQAIVVMSASITMSFISLLIFLDSYFRIIDDCRIVFWISIVACIVSSEIINRLHRRRVKRSLNKLNNPTFPLAVKSADEAFTAFIETLHVGHENIYNCQFVTPLMTMFPDNLALTILFARFSLYLSHFPLEPHEIAPHLTPGSMFNPFRNQYYASFSRITNIKDQADMEYYNKLRNSLCNNFYHVIECIRTIYSTILDEFTSTLPVATLNFQFAYTKTISKLFLFIQHYPTSPDANFFINLLQLIYPEAPELQELRSMATFKQDYIGQNMALFPGHFSAYVKNPKLFKKYAPQFADTERKVPTDVLQCERIHQKRIAGPYEHVMNKFSVYIACLVALIFPLLYIIHLFKQNNISFSRSMHVANGFAVISKFNQILSSISPLINYNDTNDQFWDGQHDEFKLQIKNDLVSLQHDLLQYTSGFGSDLLVDEGIIDENREFFTEPSSPTFLHGNYTKYHSLLSASLILTDFLSEDHMFLKNTREDFASLVSYIGGYFADFIDYLHLRTVILSYPSPLILFFAILLLILMFIMLIFIFKNAISRFDLFFMTLRETSKASVARILDDYQKCLECISDTPPTHKKHPKKMLFTFDNFIVPLIVFLVAFLILVITSHLATLCFNNQLQKALVTYANYSFLWMNLTSMAQIQQSLKFEKVDLAETQKQFNYLINMFQQQFWTPSISIIEHLCPVCSFQKLLLIKYEDKMTYENFFYDWVSSVSMSVNMENGTKYFPHIDDQIINQFYFNLVPVIASFENILVDELYSHLRANIVIQVVLLVLYIICFIWFVFFLIKSVIVADTPFTHIVKFLNLLPESALSNDTMKILSKHSWDFAITQFNFDPLYYGSVLQILPDAVIVVDMTMTILSHNNAAKQLVALSDGESVNGHKLFETLTMSLNELANGTGATFNEIFEQYLFDDKTEIVTHRLVGTKEQQKFWYQLTILPIFDETADSGITQSRGTEHFALIFKDIGDEIRQQMMLEQETEKHFDIVNQILPTEIARRLLREERSISMTVDNVSISYCDIVQFTPWCGSQTPETVVTALNHMFKVFDEICSRYSSVTKIKCIGDCYMSAAGIFSKGLTPEECTIQMICFSLDMIDAIGKVNKTIHTNLSVRIGVAYGGPISAGVMGIHKPAFDIWGEIVNDANLMESTGVPMKVHITQECYEIIKGGNYRIDPKGDGTYFVTRH